jgi:D-alanine-D-alanine ligase
MPRKSLNQIKVCVLAGGIGSERQVSIDSGKNIASALTKAGLDTKISDITPDDLSALNDTTVDVFFPALHGKFGEDGQLQEILEAKELIFVGSGSKASGAAFDKVKSKTLFAMAGISTPSEIVINGREKDSDLAEILSTMAERFVIKPVKEGSSVGVVIVEGPGAAIEAAKRCKELFGDCIIEEFIPGKELTVGIVGNNALPIIEVRAPSSFYDYTAKYEDENTEYLFDTVRDENLVSLVKCIALSCFELIGCRHLGRVDMILSKRGVPYVLEINTLPGFTSHSLLPMAARQAGIETPRLCAKMVKAALDDAGYELK